MLVPATPYSHKFHPLLLLTTQTGGVAAAEAAAAGTADRAEYVHNITEHLKSNRAPHALDSLKKIREERERLLRGVSHSTGSQQLRSALTKGINKEGGDKDFGTPGPPTKKRKSVTTATTKKSTAGSKGGKGKKATRMSSDKDKSKSSDDPLAKALADLKETKAELKKANDTITTKEDTIKVQKMVSFRLCLG